MDKECLLREIRTRLAERFGERLHMVVISGAYARDEAGESSDIEALAVLKPPFLHGADLAAALDAVYPLVRTVGRPISVKPVECEVFENSPFPLYVNARREGIRL